MDNQTFHSMLDDFMQCIEDAVDAADLDTDCEISSGVLTITCPDRSVIIFSRQEPTHQLWLAAKSGGFHFTYDGVWRCTRSGRTVSDYFSDITAQQCGIAIQI